jgi:hypothetical protein
MVTGRWAVVMGVGVDVLISLCLDGGLVIYPITITTSQRRSRGEEMLFVVFNPQY